MLEQINEILINNAGQRLTPELLNGMAHAIRQVVEQTTSPEETNHVV